uniref:Putative ribonuclease H-like domain-containing protein n=1 Tax=Tanacetum cinerariifolium TaxID=118510 RepID=A0A6L2KVM9_TANCI|nr:putative ribonuclease H-like domain-containing protein [Tanacetum cinerariifolium]
MTGNKSYLTDYQEIDGGFIAFGGNAKEGKITGKCKIRTGKLDFEDVYFVKKLKFNLLVSHKYVTRKTLFFLLTLNMLFFLLTLSFLMKVKSYLRSGEITYMCCLSEGKATQSLLIMNEFCEIKGIRREFSVARTPQQNGIAKRKNRTLIEAARTMLAYSKFPTTFWDEAINATCYV